MSTGNRNYYDVLGVPRNSSYENVRSAFRRLALRYHPDRNKSAGAASRFREILAAYQALSDREKKAEYDRAASGAHTAGSRAHTGGTEYDRPGSHAHAGGAWTPTIWSRVGSLIRGMSIWSWIFTIVFILYVATQFGDIVEWFSEQTTSGSSSSPASGSPTTEPWRVVPDAYSQTDVSDVDSQRDVSNVAAEATVTAQRSDGISFGPRTGLIGHDPSDESVPYINSQTDVADFVAEATFGIPFNKSGHDWSSGFLVRSTRSWTSHIVIIRSTGAWRHSLRTGDPADDEILQRGTSTNVKTRVDEENHVRLVALGNRGWLFINGHYEAELDLSKHAQSGSVVLLVAWFSDDELEGHSTGYSRFRVREIQRKFGPSYGQMVSVSGGAMGEYNTLTALADGIVEISFLNAQADTRNPWNSGLVFEYDSPDRADAIFVYGNGRWAHVRASAEGSDLQISNQGTAAAIKGSGANHIRVISIGADGWLFVNNEYIAKLDLSGRREAGRVFAIGSDPELPGVSGNFSNFTIWSVAGAQ